VARETAAAAIALRGEDSAQQVCLVQSGEQWSVPWSLLGKGEVPKQTALRALREATGVDASLTDIDPRFYRTQEQVYRKGIDKMRREVHFFKVRVKAEPSGGTWLPVPDALAKVTSKTVREALEAALGIAKPPPAQAKPAKPLFDDE
jgi:ADP-ribose pyrophosphatase YjhB (NUDIX family)